jgi:hypothetical protein
VSTFRGVSEGDIIRFALNKVEPLLAEHLAFRDAVRKRTHEGIVSLEDGLAAVLIADKIVFENFQVTYQDE